MGTDADTIAAMDQDAHPRDRMRPSERLARVESEVTTLFKTVGRIERGQKYQTVKIDNIQEMVAELSRSDARAEAQHGRIDLRVVGIIIGAALALWGFAIKPYENELANKADAKQTTASIQHLYERQDSLASSKADNVRMLTSLQEIEKQFEYIHILQNERLQQQERWFQAYIHFDQTGEFTQPPRDYWAVPGTANHQLGNESP